MGPRRSALTAAIIASSFTQERADAAQLGAGIGRTEDRRAHHQDVGAGLDEFARVLGPTPPSTSIKHAGLRRSIERPRLANLFNRVRDELLPRETRVDAHHQHRVAILDDVLQHRDRRLRADRDARPLRR